MTIDESKFANKSEVIKYLVENKQDIINIKKSALKHSDSLLLPNIKLNALKSFEYKTNDDVASGVIRRAIVGNTYNWLDSQGDVLMEGSGTKTLQENKQNVLHLHDHIQQLAAKVGTFVDVFEQKISWVEIGKNIAGETTALIGLSDIKKKYNESIFNQYVDNEINQHSVGIQYVKILFAVNDPEYKEEYANWQTYANKVANFDELMKKGYFWPVLEYKLKEISAVIAGANEVTPTIQPSKSTNEPLNDTHKDDKYTDNEIDYNYLMSNFNLK